MPMTMPASTNSTISAWVTSQTGDISSAAPG
jgi:hypothetical protein